MNQFLTAPLQEKLRSESWFMPPELTPLYLTDVYGELSADEQLSYNQLHALYFHEQIIFFEQSIICPTLLAIRPAITDPRLRSGIESFIEEESLHSKMFHEVLIQIAPEMYGQSSRFFIRNGPLKSSALSWCVTHPELFPMYLWLIMLLEERAMYCSRVFLTEEGLSPFLRVQRRHLSDEVNHVRWDEQLIDAFWPKKPSWLRKSNVVLMDWLLREFIVAPRRAAVRVIDTLGERLPSLQTLMPRMKAELSKLGLQSEFQRSIFCSLVAPRSNRLMSKYTEFTTFRSYWCSE